GKGLGIFELVRDAKELDAGAFAAKYGSFFLIRTLDDGSLQPAPEGFAQSATVVTKLPIDITQVNTRLDSPEASYVYPVIPRVPGEAVTVGRLPDNDIYIDDASLSKRHAQLFVRSDGTLAIIDRESKNGTRIGKVKIDPGTPTPVAFGKTIMFGTVRLTYLPVRQLIDFVRVSFDDEFLEWDSDRTTNTGDEFDIDVEFDDG
ncbi:MAG: FHA domain-containing protein, partial [Deltaproteobacteria bacterium]|nr:FHA domain-containing protein [Deltaproteobacteria bacterium]